MKISSILLVGLLSSTAAFAWSATGDETRGDRMQQRQQHADAAFAASDSNHDGRLSQSEWQAARLRKAAEQFRELDVDRNGSLTREEMQAARGQHMRGRHGGGMREKLRALDTDGDQQLSRAEIGDQLPKLAQNFDRIDGNRDGKLSRDEIRVSRPVRGEAQR